MPAQVKFRRVSFTYFKDDLPSWEELKSKFPHDFIIGQIEKCPTSGRNHWQGYVRLAKQFRINGLKKLLPGAHFENAKGTEAQNITYCSKEDTRVSGPYESGDRQKAGKRKDLDTVREMVKAGKRLRDIAEVVKSYQGLKFAESYIKLQAAPEREPPLVYWLHGETGAGKTRWVHERARDIKTNLCRIDSTAKSVYFDPYVDEDMVLFDDYRPQRMPFSQLLAVTDRYPMRVNVKYGTAQWVPSIICFTCPYDIEECFRARCDEDVGQFLRRVNESGGRQIQFGSKVLRHNYGAVAPGFHSIN